MAFLVLDSIWAIKNIPDKDVTMPAIVGNVAFEIPAAIALAFEDPVIAITSKTSTIPVTVHSNPSKGAAATNVLIYIKPL